MDFTLYVSLMDNDSMEQDVEKCQSPELVRQTTNTDQ